MNPCTDLSTFWAIPTDSKCFCSLAQFSAHASNGKERNVNHSCTFVEARISLAVGICVRRYAQGVGFQQCKTPYEPRNFCFKKAKDGGM